MHGNLEMIELLLQHGAQVDFQTEQEVSAFKKAFLGRKAKVVKLLIEHGAKIDLRIGTESPLTVSCKEGDIDMVKALFAKGVHINPSEFPSFQESGVRYRSWYFSYAASPVNIAVSRGHVELVKWLLEEGAEIPFGALFLAISKRNSDMVEILLEHGADVNLTGERGWSALMQASYYGKSGIVKMLLKKGAKVNLQTEPMKEFALALAAERAHVEIVKLLLDEGAQINMKGQEGCTALKKVVRSADYTSSVKLIKIVQLLLKRGAEVNLPDNKGNTAFMAAVYTSPEVVRLFLDAGAMIQTLTWNVLTSLANSPQHIEVLQLLLEAGLEINRKDENGKPLLMHAHDVITVKLLLEKGANVNLQDNGGGYALLNAVRSERYDISELLLEYGADSNLQDDNGISALSTLLQSGRLPSLTQYPQLKALPLETHSSGHDTVYPGPTSGDHDTVSPGPASGGHDTVSPGPASGGHDTVSPGPTSGGHDTVSPGPASGGHDTVSPGPTSGGHDTVSSGPTSGGHDTVPPGPTSGGHDTVSTGPTSGDHDTSGGHDTVSPGPTSGDHDTVSPGPTSGGHDTVPPGPGPTSGGHDTVPPGPTSASDADSKHSTGQSREDEGNDEEEFIKEVEDAVTQKQSVDRKLAHSIFIGPPGSGKSSLMDRLLGRARKAFSSSTGVSESVVVVDIAVPSSFHAATVIDHNTWKEIDYDTSLVRQMDKENVITPTPQQVQLKSPEETTSPPTPSTASSVPESAVPEHSIILAGRAESAEATASMTSLSDSEIRKMISAVIKKCGGYEKFSNSYSKSFSLYLRDAGGQLAFQEMLSVLILGPSIFIFVFRTDQDLKKRFQVDYRVSPEQSLNCSTSSISTEEALLQCLAIVCMPWIPQVRQIRLVSRHTSL